MFPLTVDRAGVAPDREHCRRHLCFRIGGDLQNLCRGADAGRI
jgi:hypothetical protein